MTASTAIGAIMSTAEYNKFIYARDVMLAVVAAYDKKPVTIKEALGKAMNHCRGCLHPKIVLGAIEATWDLYRLDDE